MSQSDYLVTVVLDGQALGGFDTCSGGEADSDVTAKYTSEGRQVYHGKPNYGDLTVSRDFKRERDHELSRLLYARAGRAVVTVSKQPLDDDGNVWGKPLVYSGLLKTSTPPEYDANSDDPEMLELVVAVKSVA